MKPKARLENWWFDGTSLRGFVFNHHNPMNYDGGFVVTSRVISLHPSNNIAETENTLYELGSHLGFGKNLQSFLY